MPTFWCKMEDQNENQYYYWAHICQKSCKHGEDLRNQGANMNNIIKKRKCILTRLSSHIPYLQNWINGWFPRGMNNNNDTTSNAHYTAQYPKMV